MNLLQVAREMGLRKMDPDADEIPAGVGELYYVRYESGEEEICARIEDTGQGQQAGVVIVADGRDYAINEWCIADTAERARLLKLCGID